MNQHSEIWNSAKPIEPERARYVDSVPELTRKLPDYLFAVPNDETGMVDIFVVPLPALPKSEVRILLAPYRVCRVLHLGTEPFPYHHFYQVAISPAECPENPELFLRLHDVRFDHVTTNGIQELNIHELRGFAHAFDKMSPLLPQAVLLREAAKYVITNFPLHQL